MLLRRINAKYVNKVIPDVGLCIAFYDFLVVGDPFVYPGEGSSHQHVKFRVGKVASLCRDPEFLIETESDFCGFVL